MEGSIEILLDLAKTVSRETIESVLVELQNC